MKRLLLLRSPKGSYRKYIFAAYEDVSYLLVHDYFVIEDISDTENVYLCFRWMKEHLEEYVRNHG